MYEYTIIAALNQLESHYSPLQPFHMYLSIGPKIKWQSLPLQLNYVTAFCKGAAS